MFDPLHPQSRQQPTAAACSKPGTIPNAGGNGRNGLAAVLPARAADLLGTKPPPWSSADLRAVAWFPEVSVVPSAFQAWSAKLPWHESRRQRTLARLRR